MSQRRPPRPFVSAEYESSDAEEDGKPSTKLLYPPGSPNFFPALLDRVKQACPELPLDPVMFQSFMLSLMAGNRSFILQTSKEDVALVQNMVTLLFRNVVGYNTYKYRYHQSSQTPSSFLSGLFFPKPKVRNTSSQSTNFRAKSKRTRSVPAEASSASDADAESSGDEAQKRMPKSRPPLKGNTARSAPIITSPPLGQDKEKTASERPVEKAVLPQALVMSGIEHAGDVCQRALTEVILTRKVPLMQTRSQTNDAEASSWDLSEDFIMVYVCAVDPRERPPIHTTLLDHFSLSATISPNATTRQTHASYVASNLPQTGPSSHSPQRPTSVPLPPDMMKRLRELCTPTHVYIDGSLDIYMQDLISAARHFHELDGTRLTLRTHRDAEALIRAHRVLGGGDAGISLVEQAALVEEQAAMRIRSESVLTSVSEASSLRKSADKGTDTKPAGEQDIDDGRHVRVQLRWADADGGSMKFASPFMQGSRLASTISLPQSVQSEREPEWWDLEPDVRWYVSEVDVAKIVPRAITHRLRVRDGPEDEVLASVVFVGASPLWKRRPEEKAEQDKQWRRPMIKDILVKLLCEV